MKELDTPIDSNDNSLTVEGAIANLKQKEDLGQRYYAAWWLGKFRVNSPEAIAETLAENSLSTRQSS